MPLDLQASGTISLGDSYNINLGDEKLDVGGTSPIVTSSFLWRIKESNLWLGPSLSMAGIANNKFQQPGIEASSSGRILKFGAKAQYYLTPQNRFSFYLAADASYEMLTLNYRGEISMNTGGSVTTLPFRDSVKSNGFAGAVGLGVETWVDDVMLGLEARQVFAQRSGALKDSAESNTVIQAQLSWKFE